MRHPVRTEDVVGHAVGVNARQDRRTDRIAGVGIHHHIERARQAGVGKLIAIDLGVLRARILNRQVITPGVIQVAARAQDAPISLITHVGLTTAAFDVAAPDVHGHLLAGCAPHCVSLLRAQQRIVATDVRGAVGGAEPIGEFAEKVTRWRDLRNG